MLDKLRNENHHYYSSPNIIRVVKSLKMRWAGRALGVRMRAIRNVHKLIRF
jgi:hypothetical protein